MQTRVSQMALQNCEGPGCVSREQGLCADQEQFDCHDQDYSAFPRHPEPRYRHREESRKGKRVHEFVFHF